VGDVTTGPGTVVDGTVVVSAIVVVGAIVVEAVVVVGAEDVEGAWVVLATVVVGATVGGGATATTVVVGGRVVVVVVTETSWAIGAGLAGGCDWTGRAGSVLGGTASIAGIGYDVSGNVDGALVGGAGRAAAAIEFGTDGDSGTSSPPCSPSASLAHHTSAAMSRKSSAITRPTTTSRPRRSSYEESGRPFDAGESDIGTISSSSNCRLWSFTTARYPTPESRKLGAMHVGGDGRCPQDRSATVTGCSRRGILRTRRTSSPPGLCG
jgi:hypothetical protein